MNELIEPTFGEVMSISRRKFFFFGAAAGIGAMIGTKLPLPWQRFTPPLEGMVWSNRLSTDAALTSENLYDLMLLILKTGRREGSPSPHERRRDPA